MTATAAELLTVAAVTSGLNSVRDPHDWQKRVSAAKTAPQDWQALVASSSESKLVDSCTTGICYQPEEFPNQLCANCELTANPLFCLGFRGLINWF